MLVLLLTGVAGAAFLGRLRGGRFQRLGDLGLRRPLLVLVALAAQAGSAWVPSRGLGLALLATSALVVGAFVLTNPGVPGLGLVLLGLAVNVVAIAANSARMPVSTHALQRIDKPASVLAGDPLHAVSDASTRLRPLTDWVPVDAPAGAGVVSPGDVLVVAGVVLLVEQGVQRGAAARRRPRPAGQRAASWPLMKSTVIGMPSSSEVSGSQPSA